MSAVKIDPVKLPGPWTEGYVLERRHTLSSQFAGYDPFGNPEFDTKRSELGELLFRLKNRNDQSTVEPIADTAAEFISHWNPPFDLIVPVPASRTRLVYQPVLEIAKVIGTRLSKPVNATVIVKIKATPELKNIFDYSERIKLLQGAFRIEVDVLSGKRILLIDDLYRSGATATVVSQELLKAGAAAVYMLAMTKTRTRR